jgi:ubiquinone/menaquinone biosynthesis C-methylase UbiE
MLDHLQRNMTDTQDISTDSSLKAKLKESYDIIAPSYNQWATKTTSASLRSENLHKLISLLPSDNDLHVLEVGCGAGNIVEELISSTSNDSRKLIVSANDLSSTQIAAAKEKLGASTHNGLDRVNFMEGDMMSLSFADQDLDAVIAYYSLIHLPRDEQTMFISRVFSWLKPGGYLLANFAAEEMAASVLPNWLHEKGWMYWSGWGAEKTVEVLKASNFSIVESKVVEDVVDASFLWVFAQKPK